MNEEQLFLNIVKNEKKTKIKKKLKTKKNVNTKNLIKKKKILLKVNSNLKSKSKDKSKNHNLNNAINIIQSEFVSGLNNSSENLSKKNELNVNLKIEKKKQISKVHDENSLEAKCEFSHGFTDENTNEFDSKNIKRKFENKNKFQSVQNNKTKKLKDDFNNLFVTKKESTNKNLKEKKTSYSSLQINKTYVSDLFSKNPKIPQVNLKNLVKENKEQVFGINSFEDFKDILHPHLISCLSSRLNITKMTNVQVKSIPIILEGKDCLIKSVTGSGKTFSYILPIIHKLQIKNPKLCRADGIKALIIVPTRELVVQCYKILENLCKAFTFIVPGYLMGGENKHSEKNRIRKGINILVTTPGRLIDHINTTKNLKLNGLNFLIIDEADRLYEVGFEESIKKIIFEINNQKKDNILQTILLSATLTPSVSNLAGMILKDPQLIDTNEKVSDVIKDIRYTFPTNLKQNFTLVPGKLRLLTLTSFIFQKCCFLKSTKILIFMATQDIVDFHFYLFQTIFNIILEQNNYDKINFFKLHGNMLQNERMKIFQQFQKLNSGVLISTDVASRGLDLEGVDIVIQYSCPPTIEDYVHRMGRTARIDKIGECLIFILPSELNFIKHIQSELEANLNYIKYEEIIKIISNLILDSNVSKNSFREHVSKLQTEFEKKILNDDKLYDLAKKAYLSYIRAYASYPKSTKVLLPFKELHLGHLCKSFALRDSPRSLAAFKKEFTLDDKNIKKNKEKSTNSKFPKNSNIVQRRFNLPLESKVDEFGSGF